MDIYVNHHDSHIMGSPLGVSQSKNRCERYDKAAILRVCLSSGLKLSVCLPNAP